MRQSDVCKGWNYRVQIWYKAEGGFTALGIMLSDLETALGLN